MIVMIANKVHFGVCATKKKKKKKEGKEEKEKV